MAAKFAEKDVAVVSPVEKAPELASQVIKRGPVEFHSPIDALGEASKNLRIPSEGTYHSVGMADSKARIAMNAQPLVMEGTAPLHERFVKMLQSI
jgi:hypothetical protein